MWTDTVAGTSAHSDKAIGLAVRSLPIWSSKGERRRKGIRVAGETMMSGVAQWQVRAAACELLALGLRYPGEELAEAVSSGEWVEAAHEIWCALGIVLPDDWAQDVQDAVIQFIKQKIGTSKSLGVTWYGGEPTLALDVIEYISANLIEYCIDNGLDYSAGIITNGYLLTRETVSLLNKFKVQFYQITLDGNPSVHDSRRYLADGSPTFNTILQNIITCYDILPKVSLRVNIDRTNLDAGAEIAQILKDKGIGDKVTPYLGKVTNENGSSDHLCLSAQEFAKNDFEFISSDVTKSNWSSRYPIPRNNFCGADCLNSFVVGPTGALYKCWNDIGHPNRVVGSLTDSSIKAYRDIMYQYLLFDPTQDSKCRKCKFLPICMGGCPYFRQKQSPDNCYVYRSILEHNIKFAAQQLLNERQKNSDEELI